MIRVRGLVLGFVFAFATIATAADPKSELKALSGTWEVDSAEVDGKNVLESFKNAKLMLAGDQYTVSLGELMDKGTIAVDPSKSPKSMDVTGTEGANRGKTYPCIYELKNDSLSVCYGLDFQTRPREMKTQKDSQRMLIVYKRKK